LIVAGAGTGKTTVTTERISWLLAEKKAKPEEILALTFTEKAAAEMEGRLAETLPFGRIPTHISTFHAFGDQLLREFSLDVGLPPTFTLLRNLEQVLLLRENLYDLPLDYFRPRTAPGRHLKLLAQFFARIKQDDISAAEYVERVRGEEKRVAALTESPEKADAAYDLSKQKEVAACFVKYEELKADAYAIDQSDQVFMAYRLVRDHEVIRRRVRDRFKYVLVDEFQDVDVVQSKLVDLLGGTDGNITVVGDDDQSIYGFRGASVSNILNFPKQHPKTTSVVLTQNYRSTQAILDASYRLIQHNGQYRLEASQQIDKRLHSDEPGTDPLVLRTETVYDEAEMIAARIEEVLQDPDRSSKDIAVLTRKNATGEYFRAALLKRGIPVAFEGTGALYDQPEVKICLAFLDLVVNPRQHGRIRLLVTSELFGLPHEDMAKLEQARRATQASLWDQLGEMTEGEYSAAAVRAAARFREEVTKFCGMADTHNAAQVLYRWLSEHTDWVRREELSEEDVLRTQNLSKLFRRLRTFVEHATDASVGGWTEYFHDVLAYGDDQAASELDLEQDTVSVMTAHAAKGLEFHTVFVVGLAKDQFPMKPQADQIPTNLLVSANLPENDPLREERRLAYVALTRAKRQLVLTSAATYGGVRIAEPSSFIKEAMGDAVTVIGSQGAADPLRQVDQARPELALATSWQPPEPLELSYTQISTYRTCPLKFYWENVERVYVEPDSATEYGNLLHTLIAALNQARMRDRTVSPAQLDALFTEAWASRRWLFDSAEHRDQAKERAHAALRQFWAAEQARPAAHLVEESFRLTLGDVIIRGRFDRVEKDADGYQIVDYKSTDVRTQKQAEGKIAENQQLTLYAMAIKDRFGEYPKKLSLYFIESGRVASTTVSPVKVRNMEQRIADVAAGIRARDFTAKRSQHYCTPTIFNFCPGNRLTAVRER